MKNPISRLLVCVVVLCAVPSFAFTRTWTGAVNGSWSNSGNWSPAGPPNAGDDLVFADLSRDTMTNDLAPYFTVGSMTFGAIASITPFRLNGNPLTITGDITRSAQPSQLFCNVDLRLGAPVHLGLLFASYTGAIDLNGQTLTVDDTATFEGSINGSGAIVATFRIQILCSGNFSGTLTGPAVVVGSLPNMNMGDGLLSGQGTLGTVTQTAGGGGQYGTSISPGVQDAYPGAPRAVGTFHTKSASIGSAYYVDLYAGAPSDLLQVTGSVTLGGLLSVNLPGAIPLPGQSFTIIDNDGNDPVNGTFSGLPEGATITVGSTTLYISYHGGDGNDVVLVATSSIKSWTGAHSALWSDPLNWSPPAIPVAGEPLLFPGGSRADMTNDLPPYFNAGPLTFGMIASITPFQLHGNPLTLTGDITANTSASQFVCWVDVRIGAPLRVGLSSFFEGAIDVNGQSLTFDSGYMYVDGPINGAGALVTTSTVYIHSSGNFTGTSTGPIELVGSMPNMTKLNGRLSGDGTLGTVTQTAADVNGGIQPGAGYDSHTIGTLHTKSISIGNIDYVDLNPGSASDLLQVTGSVTLAGPGLAVSLMNAPVPGQSFTIIDNDGNDPVAGTFASLAEGATTAAGASVFAVTYHGGDGNDVVLTALAPTTSGLTQSNGTTVVDESTTFTATVTSTSGTVTGSVTFLDGATPLGTGPLVNGIATLTSSALTVGEHSIAASYVHSGIFAASAAAPVSHTVQRGNATVAVTPSRTTGNVGDFLTFTVALTPVAPSAGAPAGIVTLLLDGTPLTTGTAVNGAAILSTTLLPGGSHAVTLRYEGDAKYGTATSDPITVTLTPSIAIFDSGVTEGNSATKVVSIPVRIAVRSNETITVAYHSEDGTARAGEDYLGLDGTLTFAPGETGKFIDVTIVGDTTLENDETFRIVLSAPSHATLENSSATVTIVNDDASFTTATFTYAPDLTLDVDTPVAGSGPFPAIVWIGGSSAYTPGGVSPAQVETARGYIVILPTYRAQGSAVFPAQLDDLKAAIRWIRTNAAQLNVDAQHIGVWGAGTGAHLAALLGTTGSTADGTRVQAVIDMGGPTDLLHLQSDAINSCVPNYDDAFSPQSQLIGCPLQTCPASANAASPLAALTSDDAPALIEHAADDCVVPAEQSRRFYNALIAAGVEAKLRILDTGGAFGPSWDNTTWRTDVDAFLDTHLKNITSRHRSVRH